ncbi:hypothetical protein L249_8391 [Ophiocordyceps polyrhachis-furcata BCC 54312]|uniref:Uncharacterized protein n=1 Tax=Ophiocordyceps polyrhachis-furcata BCC 54312 TaxID=1330021 RepID=A0A367L668_9HYPO|nr:hypothetical protein L249_8391 [Ophiocordyceps polyrhachis-furcata BCC 54312]
MLLAIIVVRGDRNPVDRPVEELYAAAAFAALKEPSIAIAPLPVSSSNAPLKISPAKARSVSTQNYASIATQIAAQINEKAAILDALYEVKYLAYEDAVALEIYDSLRLERSRDCDRTYDIAETVKKLLEANCYLIHAYLVALKHLLRYLRGTHSLGITLSGAAYSTDL